MEYLTIKDRARFGLGTELLAMVTWSAVELRSLPRPVEGLQESLEVPRSLMRPLNSVPWRLSTLPRQATERLVFPSWEQEGRFRR